MIYYYELKHGAGSFERDNDEQALKRVQELSKTWSKKNKILILYRESDSLNGTPFVTVFESKEK